LGAISAARMAWRWWIVLLWAGAIVLLFQHLGDVPLRDWDEALVARVAEEISLRPFPTNLLPTLWDQPYLNKPPLLHALIGLAIGLWRHTVGSEAIRQVPPEWLVRAIPALCSSLIVPLVALVQWRLRPGDRVAAICTAAVALTLLPLMRHGRLAMLDGSLISAMALQWWALLSLSSAPSRSQHRHWGLIAGAAGSAILLLKAPASLPLLVGACLLLAWERRWTPRQWLPLLIWIVIGLLPGLLWHGWHLLERGPEALAMWGRQGLARVVSPVEGHSGGWRVPVLEVLEGGWPWLALWPLAMLTALQQRRSRWGFWCLGLTLLTAAAVLPLRTQLPWYSHLLWPSFALSVGPLLAQLIQRSGATSTLTHRLLLAVPCFWILAGAGLLAVQGQLNVPATVTIPAALALVFGGGLLITPTPRWRQWGAAALVALLWGALFNLFASPIWLWELSEQWSVQPAVAWLQPLATAEGPPPLLLQENERPSLNWYLGQDVTTGSRARRQLRTTKQERLVLSTSNPSRPQLNCSLIGQADQTSQPGPDLYRCKPS
jgi:4-amino-4-deoxy-L-arabinose transferase-like glycosyltransferase